MSIRVVEPSEDEPSNEVFVKIDCDQKNGTLQLYFTKNSVTAQAWVDSPGETTKEVVAWDQSENATIRITL